MWRTGLSGGKLLQILECLFRSPWIVVDAAFTIAHRCDNVGKISVELCLGHLERSLWRDNAKPVTGRQRLNDGSLETEAREVVARNPLGEDAHGVLKVRGDGSSNTSACRESTTWVALMLGQ